MAYFPMFVDLTGADCLIIGGGHVALRKVQVLLDFDANVHLIAKSICKEIKELEGEQELTIEEGEFKPEYIEGRKLVVVATNDNKLNSQVANLCNKANIPVNVVDDKSKSSFIFPSYLKEGDLVGAFSSAGNSPALTQYLKNKNKEIITPELGLLNDKLGSIRGEIQRKYKTEAERKEAYEKIIRDALGEK